MSAGTLDPGSLPDPDTLVELFVSPNPKACRDRALVLQALGIPFIRSQRPGHHILSVRRSDAERAMAELGRYEEENKDWPPRELLPPAAPGYVEGTVLFIAAIVLVSAFQAGAAFGLDWTRLGAASAADIRGGEVWRALTALFLHSGPVHLLSNILFTSLFGFLVCYTHGGGLGWCAILATGFLGNVANAFIQDPTHLSIGASTATFGAVGLLCGSEWRRRHLMKQRRIRRAAPVVMALCILAFYGVPWTMQATDVGNDMIRQGARTDVMAHVTGLLAGLAIGPFLPSLLARGAMRGSVQRLYGAGAVALVLLAWFLAMTA